MTGNVSCFYEVFVMCAVPLQKRSRKGINNGRSFPWLEMVAIVVLGAGVMGYLFRTPAPSHDKAD